MAFCNPADDNEFYSQQRMKNDRLRNFGQRNGSRRVMEAADAARRTDYEAQIAAMMADVDEGELERMMSDDRATNETR